MSARQMQKLVRNDEPVFLEVVRTSNDFAPRGRGVRERKKGAPSYAALNFAHGMIEGHRGKLTRSFGLKNI